MNHLLPLPLWVHEYLADTISFVVSTGLVAGYYLFLRRQAVVDPTYSIHSVNAIARRLWVENVMTNSGFELVAVQSMRNFIMVCIAMASTASVLIIGTLTLSGQAQNITRSWHMLTLLGSHSAGLWIFKVLLLLVDFIVAFFSYAMAMRLATHVLFMFNVPQSAYCKYDELKPACVSNRLIRAGNFITVGMRAFLFAVPMVFWLFGPLFLFFSTVGLVITLYRLDRSETADSLLFLRVSTGDIADV
jgi:uncharacterized membrane protein